MHSLVQVSTPLGPVLHTTPLDTVWRQAFVCTIVHTEAIRGTVLVHLTALRGCSVCRARKLSRVFIAICVVADCHFRRLTLAITGTVLG
jgi:hypothetical protein